MNINTEQTTALRENSIFVSFLKIQILQKLIIQFNMVNIIQSLYIQILIKQGNSSEASFDKQPRQKLLNQNNN